MDLTALRQRVGMVFQKPNPFPQTVYDNIAFGPRVLGLTRNRAELNSIVERSLRQAALWDEVKDHLQGEALELSLGAAAAAVHRPRPGGAAGGDPDG